MKHHLLSLAFIFIFSSLSAQTNRALIVTISNYPVQSGWEKLHAYNDVTLLHSLLTEKGYSKPHTTVLAEEQATKKNIMEALDNLCTKTSAGDYVYLHFSCHGQQMMDDNGDEEDGLDEALIPIDAGFWYIPEKYTGENHLRDDELGQWIDRIRRKAGYKGQVTVVLDACHSGTANRINDPTDYIRGTAAIFAPTGYVPKEGKHTELSLRLVKKSGFAPAVVFSACHDKEINYEYYHAPDQQYYGFLTYAFKEVLNENKVTTTLSAFMNLLEQKMRMLKTYKKKIKQTPYMECTDKTVPFKIAF